MAYIRLIQIISLVFIVQATLSWQAPMKLKSGQSLQKHLDVTIDEKLPVLAAESESNPEDLGFAANNKTSETELQSNASLQDGDSFSAQESHATDKQDQSTQTDMNLSFKEADVMPKDNEAVNHANSEILPERQDDLSATPPPPNEIVKNHHEKIESKDDLKPNFNGKIVEEKPDIGNLPDKHDVKSPVPVPKPADAIEAIGTNSDPVSDKENVNKPADAINKPLEGQLDIDLDVDESSSPTVIWFALFSIVTIVSVVVYVHRSGLRVPPSLGLQTDSGRNHAEEIPLMTNIDRLVSGTLLGLQVPSSAIERYLQAFHSRGITSVEQLDDNMWKELALPSAIELELKRRLQQSNQKLRSPGLALHRDHVSENGSRSAPNVDDMEFDDWSFDDEDINDEI